MILQAKTYPISIPWLIEYFQANLWEYPMSIHMIPDLELDTVQKKAIPSTEEHIIPYTLKSMEDFAYFISVVEDRVVARFNNGKTDFTFVDFELFDKYLVNDYSSFMNDMAEHTIDSLTRELRMYINRIIFHPEDRHEFLSRMQLAAYQLTTLFLGITLDKNSTDLDIRVFEPMAQVLMYGAKKYERDNWRKPDPNPLSSAASLYRHIRDIKNGELVDKESKIHHIGHIMCNVMFLTYNLK